jgi:hypothetical protein
MRGKIVLGLFVLTLAAMFAAVQYRKSLDDRAASEKRRGHIRAHADNSAKAVIEAATQDAAETASTAQAPSVVAPSDPQFQQWIREEAKSLDNLSVNGERKEAEIREVVRKITPTQARQLRQTVMHPQSAAREKILSAYLLVEGGLNTRAELQKAISAPLAEKGGEPHSEDEIKGVREKSVRIMMIDGLFAQAQKDPSARETLARAIVDSEDPYIKAYAQEKYDQLPKR